MAAENLEAAIAAAEAELADLAARHAAATDHVVALREQRACLEAEAPGADEEPAN